MKLQTEVTPPPPREINPAISEAVEAAIMRSIEKDPEDRFQTAGEFRETLLDAGFSASGAMRGITGTHQAKANTRPSKPALSRPGTVQTGASKDTPKATRLGQSAAPSESKAAAKVTRLGAGAATATATNSAKATRLGTANTAATPDAAPQTNEAVPSFFSGLTMVHYAGVGVAGLLLLGALIAVPLMFMGGKAKVEAEAKPVEIKKEKRPQVVEAPRSEQPVVLSPPTQPAGSTTATSLPAQTGGAASSLELQPQPSAASRKTVDKPAPAPRTVAPPAPKPAAPKPAKPKGGGKSADCLLTGDC